MAWVAMTEEGGDSVSVSVTFFFDTEPVPVPEFLVDARRKNPNRFNYGFTSHIHEPNWEKRSLSVDEFLVDRLRLIKANGVTPDWLAARGCRLRIYISLHSGGQLGDIHIAPATLALVGESGAELKLDAP